MRRTRRLALVSLGTAAALVTLAAPAWAHVTVTAPGATSGGSDQEITFRVPVEKNLDTVGLTIQLPQSTPIADVLVAPVPGWTHTQTTVKLAKPITTDDGPITSAVSEVSWKAGKGAGLAPGEYGDFTIIAGQLPSASSLTFKALQTYSDGSVVKWIEVAAPGSSSEPENPAPVLSLAPAEASTGAGSTSPGTPGTTAAGSSVGRAGTPSTAATASSSGSSTTGPWILSIVALVVALAAGGFAFVSSRGRRT